MSPSPYGTHGRLTVVRASRDGWWKEGFEVACAAQAGWGGSRRMHASQLATSGPIVRLAELRGRRWHRSRPRVQADLAVP